MFDSVPQFRTVFRDPTHDMLALNVKDARIREGLRITQAVISSFKEILGKKNINFLVVMIHNKPYAYSRMVRNLDPDFEPAFFELVNMEQHVTRLFVEYFDDNAISYIDAHPFMQSRFSQGIPPYTMSDDHHPNSAGYEAIAQSASAALINF